MIRISIDEMQRDLIGYLHRVEAGETVVIVEADKAVAELKPVLPQVLRPRPFGLAKGEFQLAEDFDAPLSDDLLDLFEGA